MSVVTVLLRVYVTGSSMFHPNLYWWRLVLTLRKLSEAVVALMLSSKPLFQAWYDLALSLTIPS